jgi:hypothetical protein
MSQEIQALMSQEIQALMSQEIQSLMSRVILLSSYHKIDSSLREGAIR